MIKAEHLTKEFMVKVKGKSLLREKKIVSAVRDVSLEIEKGQIVGLLGVNGAGKTTTIKMLSTLLEPTAGSYEFDGIDAVVNPMAVKRKINMIAGGERMLYWRLTARENLWYYGQIYGVERKALKERMAELLELAGLTEHADVPVETFSKGMKQRLQIARGLINDPDYLFLDEPTIGLDAVVSRQLREHIRYLAGERKKGILLTSHYMGEMEELCDVIYVMQQGRIIHKGSARQLAAAVFERRKYVVELYDEGGSGRACLVRSLEAADPEAVFEEKGTELIITGKKDLSYRIADICSKNGLLIRRLYEQEPSLEDTVLRMVEERGEGA